MSISVFAGTLSFEVVLNGEDTAISYDELVYPEGTEIVEYPYFTNFSGDYLGLKKYPYNLENPSNGEYIFKVQLSRRKTIIAEKLVGVNFYILSNPVTELTSTKVNFLCG